MRIEILNTDHGHPINPYLRRLGRKLELEHSVSIVRSQREVTNGDFLFLVSCNEILGSDVFKNFKHAMVLHASDLPKGRGWSPHIWEILNGAEQITVSLLDAAAAVDCGDIYKKITIDIPKSALWDEINDLLFVAEIQLIEFAIENCDNLQKFVQDLNVEATFYPKRNPKDSEIDPNKSINEQFDLIRVCDPNRFPALFHHRGKSYKIILEKL
ncbi:MAG: formyltransferase family protein [Paracoccaceae bacterium]